MKVCYKFPQSFGSKFIKRWKNTRIFRNQTIPPNVPLAASTAVATTLTKTLRGKSILFCSKSEYKYNHIMLRKFILLSLFLCVQRRHFWQNFRHFFDERPQIFGSESKKMCAEGGTFQKLHFASMCCSWHVECRCNNPAETFALRVQIFCSITAKGIQCSLNKKSFSKGSSGKTVCSCNLGSKIFRWTSKTVLLEI